MPEVSVLLPVFNAERWLARSVESVLGQTFRDFELLAIDDGSADGSRAMLEAFAARDRRVRVLGNERNLGLARTLNRGLAEARAELVARQDADDVAYHDRLERQVAFLETHPEVALLGGQARAVDAGGAPLGHDHCSETDHLPILWCLLFRNEFVHTTVVFRKRVVSDEMGGYDESDAFAFSHDYELWTRLCAVHRAANLPCRVADCRELGASMTGRMAGQIAAESRRISAALIRRLFPDLDVSEAGAGRAANLRLGVEDEAELAPSLTLFDRLQTAFLERFPETARHPRFATLPHEQLAHLAYLCLPRHRLFACRLFARVFQAAPELALRQPWARIVALGVLGDAARRLYRRTPHAG